MVELKKEYIVFIPIALVATALTLLYQDYGEPLMSLITFLQQISPDAMTILIALVVAVITTFSSNYVWWRFNRPRLEIDKGQSPLVRLIHLNAYSIKINGAVHHYEVPYLVNRLVVRNNGRTAAKNCKATLVIGNVEEKVCWSIPKERYMMTINAGDHEYVDVCAICVKDPKKIIENIKKQEGPLFEAIGISEKDIKRRLAPTEWGWGSLIRECRDLGDEILEASLKISSSNSKCARVKIRIKSSSGKDGKIVEFI